MRYQVGLRIFMGAAGCLFFWMGSSPLPEEAAQLGAIEDSVETNATVEASGGHLIESEARWVSPQEIRPSNKPNSQAAAEDQVGDNLRNEGREPAVENTVREAGGGHVLRSEEGELSARISELFHSDPSALPEKLDFPLFDDQVVTLKSLRRQSIATNRGVVLAKAEGEPDGGHVVLSYVGDALAGTIHLPFRGEYYEIRTAPDGRSHILSQLDPARMPRCGVCADHQIE